MREQEARELCVRRGASPEGIELFTDTLPLSYMPGGGCRVMVKAVGDLIIDNLNYEGSKV